MRELSLGIEATAAGAPMAWAAIGDLRVESPIETPELARERLSWCAREVLERLQRDPEEWQVLVNVLIDGALVADMEQGHG